MKQYLFFLAFPVLLLACQGKKKSPAESEKVDLKDFIGFFQPVKLPFLLTDDSLRKKETDSMAISYKIFSQFIDDTVVTKYFGKGVKPKLYPLGKVKADKKETYLFLKAITSFKKIAYVICFDRSGKFVAAKPLIISITEPGSSNTAVMDPKYTISVTHQRKTPGGQVFYKKEAFVFNPAGGFTLILRESNEATPKSLQIINPIEALSHKHKFSGDYLQDSRNFISVRDGKDASHIVIFIHFEKNDGDCRGELKGSAKFISSGTAVYRANGDPCAVEFTFTANRVSIKEVEGCGNHRDIKCFFDGSFLKRKELETKSGKKKNK
jgi:hypothetical protein